MSKYSREFQQAYKQLNQQQLAAVNAIEGPVMVVAGPGTGKTQTVALRIANILLKTDTEPDSILALTFTESGARAMRQRLISFIGHSAYYVTISTFHAFCTEVIRDNSDLFTIDPSREPISELERLKIFHSLIDQGKWHYICPPNAPHYYTKALMAAIKDLKREGVDTGEFEDSLKKEENFLNSKKSDNLSKQDKIRKIKDVAKNKELLAIYRSYQDYLLETKRFDFEDMINLVTDAYKKDEQLLRTYQERFQYFLVDEYQDTNSAQNEVVDLLASYWKEDANVFVVGDPDQAIYRFQGASIENMLSFSKKYPSAQVITLQENYRSTQNILDSVHNLITHNNLRIDDVVDNLDPHLNAAIGGKGNKVLSATLSSQTAEAVYIAHSIKKAIKAGTSPSEIAVIYHNNADAKEISPILAKFNIEYVTQGGGNILEDPAVQRFIKILRVIRDMRTKQDDLNLFTILHYDIFEIDSLDVLKISRKAADLPAKAGRRATLFDVIEDSKTLEGLGLKDKDKIEKVLEKIATWQNIDANKTFVEFFESVLNESGYLDWLLNSNDAFNKISRINTLFAQAKRMNTSNHEMSLEDFLQDLSVMEDNNIRIEELTFAPREDAIVLTTAHSAKGLEWENVFLYKTYDGQWGNNRNRKLIRLPENILPNSDISKKEKNEDERRLFYVASTRAKKALHITMASNYSAAGRTRETVPTMFLAEMGDNIQKADTSEIEKEAETSIETLLKIPKTITHTKREDSFLSLLVDKFTLSATSLNTYLECAYKFKLNNLLRVPRAKASYLSFGTAIHSALESFYSKMKEDMIRPSKKYLIEQFREAIGQEILTPQEQDLRTAQGETILSAYYEFFQDEITEPLLIEKFSRVHLEDSSAKAGLPAQTGITLTGKMDRLEWYDESDRSVRVVDYKTGKPKTKGQIMGTTQDSHGNLHRQLVFYRILIELDRRLKVSFGEAELDFVQAPHDKSKSGKTRIKIDKGEVEELKKTIRAVMSEIRVLKFPRTTDYTNCTHCEFKDHCWPEGIPTAYNR